MLIGLSEFILKSLHFLLKVRNYFHFWIYILLWLITYICSSCRIVKCRDRLRKVFFRRWNACYHQAKRVPSKRMLQKRSKLWITVRNMLHILSILLWAWTIIIIVLTWDFTQPVDDFSQHKERLINVYRFLSHCRRCRLNFFRPSQVYKLKSGSNSCIKLLRIDCFNCECENAVRSWALMIKIMSSHHFIS